MFVAVTAHPLTATLDYHYFKNVNEKNCVKSLIICKYYCVQIMSGSA